MELDRDLIEEIRRLDDKLRRREARIGACLIELFDWLAQRDLARSPPKMKAEWEDRLGNHLSRQVYDVAVKNRWTRPVQIGRPVRGIMGAIADDARLREVAATNRSAYRQPTFEELRRYWEHRFSEWVWHFENQRGKPNAVDATVPGTEVVPRHGRRGPLAKIPHAKIVAIVKQHGWPGTWREEPAIGDICDALDQEQLPLAAKWKKWQPKSPRSWKRALEYDKRRVVKHLEYCLEMANRSETPGTPGSPQ